MGFNSEYILIPGLFFFVFFEFINSDFFWKVFIYDVGRIVVNVIMSIICAVKESEFRGDSRVSNWINLGTYAAVSVFIFEIIFKF